MFFTSFIAKSCRKKRNCIRESEKREKNEEFNGENWFFMASTPEKFEAK